MRGRVEMEGRSLPAVQGAGQARRAVTRSCSWRGLAVALCNGRSQLSVFRENGSHCGIRDPLSASFATPFPLPPPTSLPLSNTVSRRRPALLLRAQKAVVTMPSETARMLESMPKRESHSGRPLSHIWNCAHMCTSVPTTTSVPTPPRNDALPRRRRSARIWCRKLSRSATCRRTTPKSAFLSTQSHSQGHDLAWIFLFSRVYSQGDVACDIYFFFYCTHANAAQVGGLVGCLLHLRSIPDPPPFLSPPTLVWEISTPTRPLLKVPTCIARFSNRLGAHQSQEAVCNNLFSVSKIATA